MIEINDNYIMTDTYEIIVELKRQLSLNGINRFAKFIDSGDNIMTCCPFHKGGQERKPSFGIHKKEGTCHCFGCGWAGSLQEMISNCFGYDDLGKYGNKWLIKNFLSVSVESRPNILEGVWCNGENTRNNISIRYRNINRNNIDDNNSINYIAEGELDKYRYTHPYMYKRKLTDEIIELFDIGYDRDTECITFPIRDIKGNTLFIARRSVKTKFFNYPQNVEKPVYGLYEYIKDIKSENDYMCPPSEVIICESMIDALTCWVYGKYAVALNGLGNDLQFKQLNSMPCRKFILATDMDEAGLEARDKIKKALSNKLVSEYKWDKNIAKDINDMDKEYFDNLKEYL